MLWPNEGHLSQYTPKLSLAPKATDKQEHSCGTTSWRGGACSYIRAWSPFIVTTQAPTNALRIHGVVSLYCTFASSRVYWRFWCGVQNVWTRFQINHYPDLPGCQCATFGMNRFSGYSSAHAWKKRFHVEFLTYPSIPYFVSVRVTVLRQF